jgi:hypothetical protein
MTTDAKMPCHIGFNKLGEEKNIEVKYIASKDQILTT